MDDSLSDAGQVVMVYVDVPQELRFLRGLDRKITSSMETSQRVETLTGQIVLWRTVWETEQSFVLPQREQGGVEVFTNYMLSTEREQMRQQYVGLFPEAMNYLVQEGCQEIGVSIWDFLRQEEPPIATSSIKCGEEDEALIGVDELSEIAFCMIKPDGAAVRDEIIRDLEERGFVIVSAITREEGLAEEVARVLYREHLGKKMYKTLVSYIGSGEVTLIVLRAEGRAYERVRAAMGRWDGQEEGTLRQRYGVSTAKYPVQVKKDGVVKTVLRSIGVNKIHGSDSELAVAREILVTHTAEEVRGLFTGEAIEELGRRADEWMKGRGRRNVN